MERGVKQPSTEDSEYRELKGIALLAGGIPSLVELIGASMWVAPLYGGPKQSIPFHNPLAIAHDMISAETLHWSPAAWGGLGTVVGGGLLTIGATAWTARWACDWYIAMREERRRNPRRRKENRRRAAPARAVAQHAVDDRAKYMGRGGELDDLCWAAVERKALELGVGLAPDQVPGVLIGLRVVDGQELFGSYEDLHLDIWGPRQGKSTSG